MVKYYGSVRRVCLCANPKLRKGYGQFDRLRCTRCHADIVNIEGMRIAIKCRLQVQHE